MTELVTTELALRALNDFRHEVSQMPKDAIELLSVERRLHEQLNALGRALMKEVFERADATSSEVEISGGAWGNRQVTRGTYTTVFGEVSVNRSTYQQRGRGRVAIPLDLRLGIVEGSYTPRMARIMGRAVGLMPEHDAEALLHEIGVAMVSVSTLHRIPRAIAARYEQKRDIIERSVRDLDAIPAEAATVQVSLDGVMVPQDGELARPRGRQTSEPEPPRHAQRYEMSAQPTPADDDGTTGRSWHEASVGVLHFVDAEGKSLKTIYLARMPEPHKATLVNLLGDELDAIMLERPELNVVFASDGALGQWLALNDMASKLPSNHQGHAMGIVDFFHVAEYLTRASTAVWGQNSPEARVRARTWGEWLKEYDDGPTRVLKALRYQRDRMNEGKRLEELLTAIRFISNQNNQGRLAYAEAKRRNYPIGTGVTEAAAKTVVNVRMKRAGSRFSQHGGQTIMLFRCAVLSDRFNALMNQMHADYTRTVVESIPKVA